MSFSQPDASIASIIHHLVNFLQGKWKHNHQAIPDKNGAPQGPDELPAFSQATSIIKDRSVADGMKSLKEE